MTQSARRLTSAAPGRWPWREWATTTLAEATGRAHRRNPTQPGSGGPAGNALLTAWTGLILLALFLIELATLINLRDWLSWHILVGVLLVPPALLKTASTSWRIAGYYAGRRPYLQAGPPPMPLRVLGPLVVAFTLAVLGSGLTLIALGPSESRRELVPTPLLPITVLNLHKGAFVVWAGVTGLHTLGRLAPAFHILTTPGDVPGRRLRGAAIVATLLVAVVAATVVLGWSDSWLAGRPDPW